MPAETVEEVTTAEEMEERKVREDMRNQVQECQVKPGDKDIMKQEKTSVKPPYDPKPYRVMGIKDTQITHWRGGK